MRSFSRRSITLAAIHKPWLPSTTTHKNRLKTCTHPFMQIYNASGYPQALAAINHDQSQATDEDTREKYEVSKRWLMYQVRVAGN